MIDLSIFSHNIIYTSYVVSVLSTSDSITNRAPALCQQSQVEGSGRAVWRGGCWDVLAEDWRAGYATWGRTGGERDTTVM